MLTYTCKRCNKTLGSRIDNHLVTWWHDELFDIKVQAPGVPGQRSLGPTALPPAFDSLSPDSTKITALLESAQEPNPVRVQLAALSRRTTTKNSGAVQKPMQASAMFFILRPAEPGEAFASSLVPDADVK